MKPTRLLNAATLTIGLILGQYIFALDQSSAQTEISFEGLEMDYGTTDSSSLRPLREQELSVDENGNYIIFEIGRENSESEFTFQGLFERVETKPEIKFGNFKIEACGIQEAGFCFNIPLF
jgi:hypothetical protein